jgi:NLR family CARD domain containing 5
MLRQFFVLVSAAFLVVSGCSKKESPQNSAGLPGIVPNGSSSVAVNPANLPSFPIQPERGKEQVVSEKTNPVDLRLYGLVAVIDLPDTARIRPTNSGIEIQFFGEKPGVLMIGEGSQSIAERKLEILKDPKNSLIIDEPGVILAEMAGFTGSYYEYYANLVIGAKTYRCSYNWGTIESKAAALGIAKTVSSIRQSEELKQWLARIETIRKVGFEVDPSTGRLSKGSANVTDETTAALQGLRGIRSIDLSVYQEFTAKGMRAITSMPDVTSLSLHGDGLTDETVLPIREMKQLRELSLCFTRLTDAGLSVLAPLLEMRQLNLALNRGNDHRTFTGPGLVHLKGMKHLEWLNLSETQAGNEGMEHLAGLTALKTLLLEQTRVSDAGLVYLSGLTRLAKLDLSQCAITDAALQNLAGMTEMKELKLYKTGIEGPGLQHLTGMSQLDLLNLAGSRLNNSGAKHIRHLPIRKLYCQNTWIDDDAMSEFGQIKSLYEFYASETRLTDAGLVHLSNLNELVFFHAEHTGISGTGLAHLASLPKLWTLHLDDTPITDAGLVSLKQFPELNGLYVSHTAISDAGLQSLLQVPKLTTIGLVDTFVTAAGIKSFEDARKGMRSSFLANTDEKEPELKPAPPPVALADLKPANPEELHKRTGGMVKRNEAADGKPIVDWRLNHSDVTDVDLANLRDLKSLELLDLTGCAKVSDGGLTYLAGLTNLRVLRLTGTSVKGDGLVHIQGMSKLTELRLPDVFMSTKQLAPLGKLVNLERLQVKLRTNVEQKLKLLAPLSKLREIEIDQYATNFTLSFIAAFKELESLRFAQFDGSDYGLRHLVGLKSLQVLHMGRTKIGEMGMSYLKELKSLRELVFSSERIDDRSLMSIEMLTNLETVALPDSSVGDDTLKRLCMLPKLKKLNLGDTLVSNAGLAALKHARNLEGLYVHSCKNVTDEALESLKQAPKLREVNLRQTKFSKMAAEALRKAKPELEVFINE